MAKRYVKAGRDCAKNRYRAPVTTEKSNEARDKSFFLTEAEDRRSWANIFKTMLIMNRYEDGVPSSWERGICSV